MPSEPDSGSESLTDEELLAAVLASSMNGMLLSVMIRAQLLIQRYAAGLALMVRRRLDATEADMADRLRSRLLEHDGGQSQAGRDRIERALDMSLRPRREAWDSIIDDMNRELDDLAALEPRMMAERVRSVSLTRLPLGTLPPEDYRRLVRDVPMEGRSIRDWLRALSDEDARRVEAQVRAGITAGESSKDIARRVVGTGQLRGTDGVTQLTRRQVESLTRTIVNHVTSTTRRAWVDQNRQVFDGEVFVATLDARTTALCRSLDGEIYPVGEGPHPPLHYNCRSLRVPSLDPEFVGERPFVAVAEKRLLRDYAEQAKIPVPTSRAGLPRGHKSAFDDYARRRKREMTGRARSDLTYQEWLTQQPASFQDDVLGRTKARLFRSGGLTLSHFVHRTGDELTLQELARLHSSAFRAAGLDPDRWL